MTKVFHRPVCGLQVQAKLLLKRIDDRRVGDARRWLRGVVVGHQFQPEIILAGQPGLVHNRAADSKVWQRRRKTVHGLGLPAESCSSSDEVLDQLERKYQALADAVGATK